MPTLYIVATPIGNLEDVTLRALRLLAQVRLIAAEDTRTTRKLLARHNIHTPLTSFHDRNAARKTPAILEALREGDVALVSEAGMPAISDPGYELVTAALEQGFPVVAAPGPSAVTTAVAVSGLPGATFLFLGFLPRRGAARRRLLERVKGQQDTLVLFEAPHRLGESLRDILATLGDRRMAVCRELTKLHEEVYRGRVSDALAQFTEPRGEFTLVVEGADPASTSAADPEEARRSLLRLRGQGLRARAAVGQVAAATGLSRREVYSLWLGLPGGEPEGS